MRIYPDETASPLISPQQQTNFKVKLSKLNTSVKNVFICLLTSNRVGIKIIIWRVICIKIVFYIYLLSNSFSTSGAYSRETFLFYISVQREIQNIRQLYLNNQIKKMLEGFFIKNLSLFLVIGKNIKSLLKLL